MVLGVDALCRAQLLRDAELAGIAIDGINRLGIAQLCGLSVCCRQAHGGE